jgi:E3 ubiquitin-protein ligase RNF5
VCKAGISKDKVIPLYGRGDNKQQDPREKLPPRPPGQRSEPETQGGGFGGFGFDGGFQMSFGIGAFPFGFFTSSFNFGDPRPGAPVPGSTQAAEEQFLSKVFIWIAIIFVFWLIIA